MCEVLKWRWCAAQSASQLAARQLPPAPLAHHGPAVRGTTASTVCAMHYILYYALTLEVSYCTVAVTIQ